MWEFNKLLSSSFRGRSQQGSTLIELMVATSVVVIALTALMASLTLTVRSTAQSKYRTYATNLGQEALEVYRRERSLQGWNAFYNQVVEGTVCLNTLPSDTEAFNALVIGDCDERFQEAGTDFTRTVEVTKVSGGGAPNSVVMSVMVDWYDGSQLRTVTLEQTLKEY